VGEDIARPVDGDTASVLRTLLAGGVLQRAAESGRLPLLEDRFVGGDRITEHQGRWVSGRLLVLSRSGRR
jgi:hypothetical protein